VGQSIEEVLDMKKLFVAVAVLAVPIFIATGVWALSVNDQEGVPGAYYGGILTTVTHPLDNDGNPTTVITPNNNYAHDVNPAPGQPGDYQFSVTGLTATKLASGDIQVVLTGPYFGTLFAYDLTKPGNPGDLYISSTGWRVSTPSADGHADADKFVRSTEGWNYVVSLGTIVSNPTTHNFVGTGSLFQLNGAYTETSAQSLFSMYRTDQAWRGGYSGPSLGAATATLAITRLDSNFTEDPLGTLTFTFANPYGWDPNQLGYHWTMGCGNDVVEGGGTPVPEPGSLLLLGLGLAGLGVYRRKAARG